MTPRYVTIANPDGLRQQAFAAALETFRTARGLAIASVVVPWRDIVPRLGSLDGIVAFDHLSARPKNPPYPPFVRGSSRRCAPLPRTPWVNAL